MAPTDKMESTWIFILPLLLHLVFPITSPPTFMFLFYIVQVTATTALAILHPENYSIALVMLFFWVLQSCYFLFYNELCTMDGVIILHINHSSLQTEEPLATIESSTSLWA